MISSFKYIGVYLLFLFSSVFCFAQLCGNEFDLSLDYHTHREASLVSYKVPIVFHVLYSDSNTNISDSIIYQGISALNLVFDSLNLDHSNDESLNYNLANPNIRFSLAETSNEILGGINRVETTVKSFNIGISLFTTDYPKYSVYGGSDAVSTDNYLNIWVCNLDPTPQNPKTLLGYAFPPTLANDWDFTSFVSPERQGVVINYKCFLNPKYANILAHEIGHYLGLKHLWGNSTQSCDNDDGIDDTPLSATPSYVCDITKNTCNIGADDLPDMVQNVMDYSPASCGKYFTYGQVQRMVNNLVYLRPDLYTAEVGDDTLITMESFQNPSIGKFTVFLNTKNIPSSTLEIMGLDGKVIYSSDFSGKKQLVEIPPEHYRHGLYILRLYNKKFCITKKIQFVDR